MKIILISITLLLTSRAIACDCLTTPLENQFKGSQYVLRVKIVKLLDTNNERIEYHYPDNGALISYRVKARILTSYKGEIETQEIELSSEFTNCEPLYKLNHEYLLFVDNRNNKYFVVPCTSWTEIDGTTRKFLKKIKRIARGAHL